MGKSHISNFLQIILGQMFSLIKNKALKALNGYLWKAIVMYTY